MGIVQTVSELRTVTKSKSNQSFNASDVISSLAKKLSKNVRIRKNNCNKQIRASQCGKTSNLLSSLKKNSYNQSAIEIKILVLKKLISRNFAST